MRERREREGGRVRVCICDHFFGLLSFNEIKNRNKQTQNDGEKWHAISYHKLHITEFKRRDTLQPRAINSKIFR